MTTVHQLLLTALLLGPITAPAQSPDTIFHNGKILTADESFRTVTALAVRGGRIVAADDTAKVRALAGPTTKLVDLQGRTVIPGLIDNHLHFLRAAGTWRHETRIEGVTSRAQALERIAARARSLKEGQWVFVLGGWTEEQFADRPGAFTREELDQAAPKNPVLVQKSYTSTYLNSLAEAALNSGGPRGPGGTGGRTGGKTGGKSTGGGTGNARDIIARALARYLPEPDAATRLADIKTYATALNAMGLTTVYDVGRDNDGPVDAVAQLAQRGELTVRAFHTLRYSANDPAGADRAAALIRRTKPLQADDWTGLIGIGEHTYSPLHDSALRPTEYPAEVYEQFEKLALAAAAGGWHLHDHAMQDQTIRRYLDIFERVTARHPVARWTLAHCDYISPESIARAKQLGLTLAIHNKTAKPAGRGVDSPPLRAIQDSGIVWGLGSDGSIVAPVNPFFTLWWAVTGKIFPDKPAIREPVTREQALVAHTRANAFLLFKEKDLGSLEPGKLADFVVLNRDYAAIPADEIRELRPVMTVVGGKVVFENAGN